MIGCPTNGHTFAEGFENSRERFARFPWFGRPGELGETLCELRVSC